MKKFSVLLVAILALMMLFVSCENEPEKRAATKEDGEIINGLFYAMRSEPVDKTTVDSNEDEDTIEVEFIKTEYKDGENVVAVLNGTLTGKEDKKSETTTFSVDFRDGTKYKGKDHTLLAKVVVKMPAVEGDYPEVVSSEIMLDGVILTDFDFDYIFKTIFGKP